MAHIEGDQRHATSCATEYANAKAMCSDSDITNRKNNAKASPTMPYCTGWMPTCLRASTEERAEGQEHEQESVFTERSDMR